MDARKTGSRAEVQLNGLPNRAREERFPQQCWKKHAGSKSIRGNSKHTGMEYGNDTEVLSQAACLPVRSGTEITSQKLLKYI